MLPEQNRLRHAREFGAVVRRRRGVGRDDVVVYARRSGASATGVDGAAPRFGFIVAKSVGSSVDRHRVTRQLRHVCRALLADMPPDVDVVVRALPGSATATSHSLERQIRSALVRLRAIPVPVDSR